MWDVGFFGNNVSLYIHNSVYFTEGNEHLN